MTDMYKVKECLELSAQLRHKWNHNNHRITSLVLGFWNALAQLPAQIRIWAMLKYLFHCTLLPSIEIGISCMRVPRH